MSSPLGRIWGIYPAPITVIRAVSPTYPASRQRFSSTSSGASKTFASNTSAIIFTSWVLAPHMTIERGMPCSSTKRFLLTPFFSPIRWILSNWFSSMLNFSCFSHRWFYHTSICWLPLPGNPLEFIILRKTLLPYSHPHSFFRPMLEISMNRARCSVFFWHRFPHTSCTKDIENACKHLTETCWFSSSSNLSFILFSRVSFWRWKEWFELWVESIRELPRTKYTSIFFNHKNRYKRVQYSRILLFYLHNAILFRDRF